VTTLWASLGPTLAVIEPDTNNGVSSGSVTPPQFDERAPVHRRRRF
jgi:hypothetical protein